MVPQGQCRVLFSGGGLGPKLANGTDIHPYYDVEMQKQTELKSRLGRRGKAETQWLKGELTCAGESDFLGRGQEQRRHEGRSSIRRQED